MKQIKTIVRMSDQGFSCPFLCIDEEDARWWCKGQLSGTQSQRNEWICAHLARHLMLPVPDFEIMQVPDGLFELWQMGHPECRDVFVLPSNPYVFASRLVPECRDLSVNSPFLIRGDRNLQARVFAFDWVIRNMDRSDGNSNVLVDVSEAAIHVIDHNSAFDPDFDKTKFQENHVFRGAFQSLSFEAHAQLEQDIRQSLATFDLTAVWDGMPEAWMDEATPGLTFEAIQDTLTARWSPLP